MVAVRCKVKKVKRVGSTDPVRVRLKAKVRGPKPDLGRVQVSEDELEASVCRDDFFEG